MELDTAAANTIPTHVALIMDGNRRWAKAQKLHDSLGHVQGVEALKALVRHCGQQYLAQGLKYLTVYAFSTENWQRPAQEVSFLMGLFVKALRKELKALHAENVCVRFVGNLANLPEAVLAEVQQAHQLTEHNTGIVLQVALNYGAQAELAHACQKIVRQQPATALQAADATTWQRWIDEALWTHPSPSPDLLIRTGGEQRLSNFLLWQCAYSQLYFTPIYWPDFNAQAFDEALAHYQSSQRRYGR